MPIPNAVAGRRDAKARAVKDVAAPLADVVSAPAAWEHPGPEGCWLPHTLLQESCTSACCLL